MVYQSREMHHQYKGMTKRLTCPRKKVILKKRQNTLSKHVWEPQILGERGHWGSHSAHNWPHRETLGHANGRPTAITCGWGSKGPTGHHISAFQCVSSLPHWDATSPSKSESTLAYRAHCMGAGAQKLSGIGWETRVWYRTQCQSHTKLPGAPAPGCSYSAKTHPCDNTLETSCILGEYEVWSLT